QLQASQPGPAYSAAETARHRQYAARAGPLPPRSRLVPHLAAPRSSRGVDPTHADGSIKPAFALAVTAVACLAFAGPALARPVAYSLDPFTSARIATAITATIVIGDVQSVSVETRHPENLEGLRLEVVGGELRAWIEEGLWDMFSFRDREIHLA